MLSAGNVVHRCNRAARRRWDMEEHIQISECLLDPIFIAVNIERVAGILFIGTHRANASYCPQ
jgi:hypothetical protein